MKKNLINTCLNTLKEYFSFVFNRDIRNIFITWNIISLCVVVISFIKDYRTPTVNKVDIFELFLPYSGLFMFLAVLIPSSIIMFITSRYICNRKVKAILWAFIIPFIAMIFYLTPNNQLADLILFLGFLSLFFVYPQLFLATLIIPEKYCSYKWDYFINIVMTIFFAFILIFICFLIKDPFPTWD